MPLSKSLYIVIGENKILDTLGSLFTEHDFQVGKFNDPEKALIALKKDNPELILCDQDFKMMSGIDCLKKARESAPQCIGILLMRNADLDVATKAVNEGIVKKIVSNPWTSEDILAAVEEGFDIYVHQQDARSIHSGVMEEQEELGKWDDLLKSSIKNRTRIILQKKTTLEKLNRELETNIYESIRALFSFLERKNRWIGAHSKKVAAFSVELALELGLAKRDIQKVEIAGLLHDIGKIGISDKIISKSYHLLSKKQQEEIKEHPLIGQKIISPVFTLSDVGTMIRHHHEHWRGTGYPNGLKEQEIPIGARVIAVANVFTNLIEKVYHRAKEPAVRSLKDLVSKSDNELDPEIVDTFIKIIEEKRKHHTRKKQEVKIHFHDLKEGMMLSRDIQTTRGTIVLSKGTIIIPSHVEYVQEFDRLEKIFSDVYIFINAEVDESEEESDEENWDEEEDI